MIPRPTRPYRALRALVGATVILTIVALWAYAQLQSHPLGTLWDVVMLLLVVASGYAVFGRRTMQHAVEDAQELSGDSSDGAADGSASEPDDHEQDPDADADEEVGDGEA